MQPTNIHRGVWGDRGFRSLSKLAPSGQALWLYLLSTPYESAIPGLIPLGLGALADVLRWPFDESQRCLDEIESAKMAMVDAEERLIFLPNAIYYRPPEDPNEVLMWQHTWRSLPECPLREVAQESLALALKERGVDFAAAFDQIVGRRAHQPARASSSTTSTSTSTSKRTSTTTTTPAKQRELLASATGEVKAPSKTPTIKRGTVYQGQRFNVPYVLHDEFVRRLGPDYNISKLHDWYETQDALSVREGPTMLDDFGWWRKRFQTSPPPGVPPSSAGMYQKKPSLRTDVQQRHTAATGKGNIIGDE